jgi:hypothetical protein
VRSLGEFAGRAQPGAGPAGPRPSPPWSGRSGRTSQAGASPLPAVLSVVAHPLGTQGLSRGRPSLLALPAPSAIIGSVGPDEQKPGPTRQARRRHQERPARPARTPNEHPPRRTERGDRPAKRQTKPGDQSGSSADKLIAVPRAPGQSREHAQQAIEQQTARGDHHHNRRHPRPTRRQPRPLRPIQHVPPGRAPTTTVPRPPPRHPYPSQSSGNACSHTVSREPSSGPKLNA